MDQGARVSPVRHVSDDERRARLAVRHALAAGSRVASPTAAAHAMVALHTTEPATFYLSCWARVDSLRAGDVDKALYDERSLVKQLAMRRTLFVFPRELLPAVWGSASVRVARTERLRIAKDVVEAAMAEDGERWLDQARTEVLAVLSAAPAGLSATEVRRAVPMIDVDVRVRATDPWNASRVLTQLGATADVVRGVNSGHWRVSRPNWTLMRTWLTDVPAAWDAADGYRELVRRWLYAFGPGTEDDLVWWLGATKGIVRAALSELGAVPVSLDRDAVGWLLPDDVAEVPDPGPWVALLPVLDSTVMGWQGRDFYLGPHRDLLFARQGNAGTTAWANGRAVGCWEQDDTSVVRLNLVEQVPARARRALEEEAARLTDWLAGVRVGTLYRSPAMKALVSEAGPGTPGRGA